MNTTGVFFEAFARCDLVGFGASVVVSAMRVLLV